MPTLSIGAGGASIICICIVITVASPSTTSLSQSLARSSLSTQKVFPLIQVLAMQPRKVAVTQVSCTSSSSLLWRPACSSSCPCSSDDDDDPLERSCPRIKLIPACSFSSKSTRASTMALLSRWETALHFDSDDSMCGSSSDSTGCLYRWTTHALS